MEYPLYRKMANGKSLYKIISDNEFIEIQYIGSKYFVRYFKLSQYPDMLFLKRWFLQIHLMNLLKKKRLKNFFKYSCCLLIILFITRYDKVFDAFKTLLFLYLFTVNYG